MPRPAFHIVICLLIALLYMGERYMPCSDFCEASCPAGRMELAQQHDSGTEEQRGNQDRQEQEHHCDHCTCICHAPALHPFAESACSSPPRAMLYPSLACQLVHTPAPPPDHIPIV